MMVGGLRLYVVCTVLAIAPQVHAQAASAEAELLFRRGRGLMADGKLAEACKAFEASNKIEPAATTLLNLGACREKNGQIASAFGAYTEAERLARRTNDPDGRALEQLAATHLAEVGPRVSKLTLRVPERHRMAGLEIRRGNELVDATTWGLPLAVDGGTYQIVARAPDHMEWTTTVTVAPERDDRVVTIPALAAVVPPARPAVQRVHAGHGHMLAVGLGALAVGALGTAVGFELWGDATYDRAKVEPDWMKQDALWLSANRKRYTAEGLAAGGVACAAAALWLYLRHDETRIVPAASAGGGALTLGVAGSY